MPGVQGQQGIQGPVGPQGPAGQDAQLPIGTIIQLPQGTPAPQGFVLLGYQQIDVTPDPSGKGKKTTMIIAVWQKTQ